MYYYSIVTIIGYVSVNCETTPGDYIFDNETTDLSTYEPRNQTSGHQDTSTLLPVTSPGNKLPVTSPGNEDSALKNITSTPISVISITTTPQPHQHDQDMFMMVTTSSRSWFDTQICPFPMVIHLDEAFYGYNSINCTLPIDTRGDHYTEIFKSCEGRLACDACEGLQDMVTHDYKCGHIDTDLITLTLSCKETLGSWRKSRALIGDIFTDIRCPDQQEMYILHLFSGRNSNSHNTSPSCLNVVKFRDSTLYDGIVEDCQGLQECNNVLARPVDMVDYCGDKAVHPADFLTLVYECVDPTDADVISPCDSPDDGQKPAIIGGSVAAAVLVIVLIIVNIIICLKKKSAPIDLQREVGPKFPESVSNVYLHTSLSAIYAIVPDIYPGDYEEIDGIAFTARDNVDDEEERPDSGYMEPVMEPVMITPHQSMSGGSNVGLETDDHRPYSNYPSMYRPNETDSASNSPRHSISGALDSGLEPGDHRPYSNLPTPCVYRPNGSDPVTHASVVSTTNVTYIFDLPWGDQGSTRDLSTQRGSSNIRRTHQPNDNDENLNEQDDIVPELEDIRRRQSRKNSRESIFPPGTLENNLALFQKPV